MSAAGGRTTESGPDASCADWWRTAGRTPLAGLLLVSLLASSVAHGFWPAVPLWPSGICAWLAALLLWPSVPPLQRTQVVLFVLVGIAAIGYAALRDPQASAPAAVLVQSLSKNHQILALLVAVYFLRLAAAPGDGYASGPRGPAAYLKTMLGVHLFGALINISALVIVADAMANYRSIDKRVSLLLTRAFSVAVFYSPFIAGMAVALSYAPGARLADVMVLGVPLAVAGLGYNFVAGRWQDPERLSSFEGYPIRFSSLWLPGALALLVLATHALAPRLSILTIISLFCPIVVFALLTSRHGAGAAWRRIYAHARSALPQMGGELTLFLGAGVLAVGLGETIASFGTQWLPFDGLDALGATFILALMVGSALVGLHPIIAVTTVAALIAPLDPQPTLAATLFVMAWGIGTASSPLSGTNLIMQGRYGVAAWSFPRWNVLYVTFMLLVSGLLLHAYARTTGLG